MECNNVLKMADKEELEERLRTLVDTGKQVEGTSSKIDVNVRPDYFDVERFKKAQATISKYYAHLSMGSTTGLILLVQIESILVPLLKTGKSRTVPHLLDRYTGTAKYIKEIYETDFYLPTSEGWKYLQIVRGMHQRVHKLMNEDLAQENPIEPPNVWVNQYDMALTQFAFVGLFLLKPSKCAAYYVTKDELADIVYYWRVISYYLSIEERFNLFVYHDDMDKQMELLKIVYNHQIQLLREYRPKLGVEMGKGIMLAFEDLTTDVSFNILDHWWSSFVSISGQERLSPYTWSDRYKLVTFILVFRVLLRCRPLQRPINGLYRRKLNKFFDSTDKIRPKLEKKYKDIVYE